MNNVVNLNDTIRFKLTDQDGFTYNSTVWGPGATYTTSGEGELCSPGWLHCYSDPVLAILMNPSHADFQKPKLCEVEVSGQFKLDHGLKEGWTTMTFKRWLPVPTVTITQRVAFGILCAKQVCTEPYWLAWADAWLSGKDRTRNTAYAAAYTATAATATAYAAAYAAAYTANAATAYAAAAAATAATAADYATATAANAATAYAAAAADDLDLVALAHQALEYK